MDKLTRRIIKHELITLSLIKNVLNDEFVTHETKLLKKYKELKVIPNRSVKARVIEEQAKVVKKYANKLDDDISNERAEEFTGRTFEITDVYAEREVMKANGIKYFRWETKEDDKVRHSHYLLNGRVFGYERPPVVNQKGERKLPGEDWNCRCRAVPLVSMPNGQFKELE